MKIHVALLALLLIAVGITCQNIIQFGQSVTYNPSQGIQQYRINQAGDRYVQFQINSASESFPFVIRELASNPFSAPLPSNNRVLGLFKFETATDFSPILSGIVSHRYDNSDLANDNDSVSPIVYNGPSNQWVVRGVSTNNVASAAVGNTDFDSQSDIFFGFIEQQTGQRSDASANCKKVWTTVAFTAVAALCAVAL